MLIELFGNELSKYYFHKNTENKYQINHRLVYSN